MKANGGRGAAAPKRAPPPPDRFLGTMGFQSSAGVSPLELSEQDIFNTPSGSCSPSSSHCSSPARGIQNHARGHHGILAALNDPVLRSRSGSDPRPVFNHKASTSVSLSSSTSTSPASSVRSLSMMIPRRPPPPPTAAAAERTRFQPRSAPVHVPKMPARRSRVLEDIVSDQEEEEEDEERSGVVLPPHEVVASRNTPMLASSVLEGAGRTLKGRDLRQVRNAIWRRTGFLD